MRITKHPLVLSLSLVFVVGCDGPGDPLSEPKQEKYFANHWNTSNKTDKGPTTLQPNVVAEGRMARRLTVAQLRKSIPLLFNGVTWEENFRGQSSNAFNALSRTLGEADYIEVTEPNTEPSPLFAKFMDDMAGSVCDAALRDDLMRPVSERAFLLYPDEVDRNLRFLRLKFHGLYVPDGTIEGLEDLRKLYDDILSDTQNSNHAWAGICVAMLTAPEFMAY
jgi:hypothetical protein